MPVRTDHHPQEWPVRRQDGVSVAQHRARQCEERPARHLPRYLAEFCYRFNHRFQLDKMVDRLLQAALHTQPVPQRLLKLAEVRW